MKIAKPTISSFAAHALLLGLTGTNYKLCAAHEEAAGGGDNVNQFIAKHNNNNSNMENNVRNYIRMSFFIEICCTVSKVSFLQCYDSSLLLFIHSLLSS
jgi:hypothetical protein